MERILFGDNQFFAVNHISDEKSRAQSIKFKDDNAIIKTLDEARGAGNKYVYVYHARQDHQHMQHHQGKSGEIQRL
jgi:hypothetical protein